MYAKIKDGKVVAWPLSVQDILMENYNVSFPSDPDAMETEIELRGYRLVPNETPPTVKPDQKVVEFTPKYQNGILKRNFVVQDLTASEVKERVAALKIELMAQIKRQHAKYISAGVQEGAFTYSASLEMWSTLNMLLSNDQYSVTVPDLAGDMRTISSAEAITLAKKIANKHADANSRVLNLQHEVKNASNLNELAKVEEELKNSF